jgi:hypothetical protein
MMTCLPCAVGLDSLPGQIRVEGAFLDPQSPPHTNGIEYARMDHPAHRLGMDAEQVRNLSDGVEPPAALA